MGGKIEPRSIKNRSKKASKNRWKKEGVLVGSGGAIQGARDGGDGWPRPPPFSPFSKNQTKQNQSTEHRDQKEHPGTPCAQARWRIKIRFLWYFDLKFPLRYGPRSLGPQGPWAPGPWGPHDKHAGCERPCPPAMHLLVGFPSPWLVAWRKLVAGFFPSVSF